MDSLTDIHEKSSFLAIFYQILLFYLFLLYFFGQAAD
jgi:hypothetical protein